MFAFDTWVRYLKCIVQEQIDLLRSFRQRERAIERPYPLPPNESNSYRRRVWTRVCREQIALHNQRKRPGRCRLRGT